jgi:phage terminase large subunit-like protein
MAELTPELKASLRWYWPFWARPDQLVVEDRSWSTMMALAGRGFGKTRMGNEWVRRKVKSGGRRGAIIAETAADARDVLVEGESGILAISPPNERPEYEPSKRRLTWPNGAVATLYNGTEPDQLRGPEHDWALVDELAKYRYASETWDNLQFGMRLGEHPVVLVTTTPRPIPVIREIVQDPSTKLVRGSTFDNAGNLAPSFLERIKKRYDGTRIGRQELYAELLLDVPGALWNASMFKPEKNPGAFERVVVAIDPSGTSGGDGDNNSVGIVVAAKYRGSDRYAIISDLTCDLGPAGWAKVAIEAFRKHRADRIVAESNFGGAMVESTLRAVDRNVPIRMVSASRGKAVRAEPVAALYEQGRVDHLPGLELLESQMMQMTTSGYVGDGSPDRVDAAVWAISDLMQREPASTNSTRVRGLI